jgi:hypothetical protein
VTTFAGCEIHKAGSYTLTAVCSGLTNDVSAGVTITVGSAVKLGFTSSLSTVSSTPLCRPSPWSQSRTPAATR